MKKTIKQKTSTTPVTDANEVNCATMSDYDAGMTKRMMVPSGVCGEMEEKLAAMTEANRKALTGLRLARSNMTCRCSNVHCCGHESDCDVGTIQLLIKELAELDE